MKALTLIIVLACAVVWPLVMPLFYIILATEAAIFGFFAMSLDLIMGYTGLVSLGHAAFFGTGAYVSTLLVNASGISPWFTLWLGGLCALLVSLPIGIICFRLQGPYFTIATIGLAEVLRLLVLHFREITNGALGLTVPFKGNAPWLLQFDSKLPYFYIALLMAICTVLITRKMEQSRLGNYLVAIGQNHAMYSSAVTLP